MTLETTFEGWNLLGILLKSLALSFKNFLMVLERTLAC